MGENTAIEWCDHTWNPWIGCTAVSPACDHCYAEATVKRYGGDFATRRRTRPANWKEPFKWNRDAARDGVRRKVFTASMADVFDNQVELGWLVDLLEVIRTNDALDWLLLTKRPQRIRDALEAAVRCVNLEQRGEPLFDWLVTWLRGVPPKHVWLGTTAENQTEAGRRIPHLLAVPAARRFLSCEPLLGPVDLRELVLRRKGAARVQLNALTGAHAAIVERELRPSEDLRAPLDDLLLPLPGRLPGIDWVIAGGESGTKARPAHPDWIRSLRDQCANAGTAFFFKQWGEWHPEAIALLDAWPADMRHKWDDSASHLGMPAGAIRVGKKAAGALLDGVLHREFPTGAVRAAP